MREAEIKTHSRSTMAMSATDLQRCFRGLIDESRLEQATLDGGGSCARREDVEASSLLCANAVARPQQTRVVYLRPYRLGL